MTPEEKVRDNRLRRVAERRGMKLTRSRRRDPKALDYGLYWLTDARTGETVSPEVGVDIDEIERRFLA
ncbi:MAG: hypothetical protein JWP40_2483 [Blastococcus sp.]|nr:hypothetical protein [Blastococcus sp.]